MTHCDAATDTAESTTGPASTTTTQHDTVLRVAEAHEGGAHTGVHHPTHAT